MPKFPYTWAWRHRTVVYPGVYLKVPWFGDGRDRVGQSCRVLVSGGSSALIEFEGGWLVVTSRRGLRRVKG